MKSRRRTILPEMASGSNSVDVVHELERGRLRKFPGADAKLLRRSVGSGVRWRGRCTAVHGGLRGGAERAWRG